MPNRIEVVRTMPELNKGDRSLVGAEYGSGSRGHVSNGEACRSTGGTLGCGCQCASGNSGAGGGPQRLCQRTYSGTEQHLSRNNQAHSAFECPQMLQRSSSEPKGPTNPHIAAPKPYLSSFRRSLKSMTNLLTRKKASDQPDKSVGAEKKPSDRELQARRGHQQEQQQQSLPRGRHANIVSADMARVRNAMRGGSPASTSPARKRGVRSELSRQSTVRKTESPGRSRAPAPGPVSRSERPTADDWRTRWVSVWEDAARPNTCDSTAWTKNYPQHTAGQQQKQAEGKKEAEQKASVASDVSQQQHNDMADWHVFADSGDEDWCKTSSHTCSVGAVEADAPAHDSTSQKPLAAPHASTPATVNHSASTQASATSSADSRIDDAAQAKHDQMARWIAVWEDAVGSARSTSVFEQRQPRTRREDTAAQQPCYTTMRRSTSASCMYTSLSAIRTQACAQVEDNLESSDVYAQDMQSSRRGRSEAKSRDVNAPNRGNRDVSPSSRSVLSVWSIHSAPDAVGRWSGELYTADTSRVSVAKSVGGMPESNTDTEEEEEWDNDEDEQDDEEGQGCCGYDQEDSMELEQHNHVLALLPDPADAHDVLVPRYVAAHAAQQHLNWMSEGTPRRATHLVRSVSSPGMLQGKHHDDKAWAYGEGDDDADDTYDSQYAVPSEHVSEHVMRTSRDMSFASVASDMDTGEPLGSISQGGDTSPSVSVCRHRRTSSASPCMSSPILVRPSSALYPSSPPHNSTGSSLEWSHEPQAPHAEEGDGDGYTCGYATAMVLSPAEHDHVNMDDTCAQEATCQSNHADVSLAHVVATVVRDMADAVVVNLACITVCAVQGQEYARDMQDLKDAPACTAIATTSVGHDQKNKDHSQEDGSHVHGHTQVEAAAAADDDDDVCCQDVSLNQTLPLDLCNVISCTSAPTAVYMVQSPSASASRVLGSPHERHTRSRATQEQRTIHAGIYRHTAHIATYMHATQASGTLGQDDHDDDNDDDELHGVTGEVKGVIHVRSHMVEGEGEEPHEREGLHKGEEGDDSLVDEDGMYVEDDGPDTHVRDHDDDYVDDEEEENYDDDDDMRESGSEAGDDCELNGCINAAAAAAPDSRGRVSRPKHQTMHDECASSSFEASAEPCAEATAFSRWLPDAQGGEGRSTEASLQVSVESNGAMSSDDMCSKWMSVWENAAKPSEGPLWYMTRAQQQQQQQQQQQLQLLNLERRQRLARAGYVGGGGVAAAGAPTHVGASSEAPLPSYASSVRSSYSSFTTVTARAPPADTHARAREAPAAQASAAPVNVSQLLSRWMSVWEAAAVVAPPRDNLAPAAVNVDGDKPSTAVEIKMLPEHVLTKQDSRKLGELGLTCIICLAEYSAGDHTKILPCMHIFHSACVNEWLGVSRSCPMCKWGFDNRSIRVSSMCST